MGVALAATLAFASCGNKSKNAAASESAPAAAVMEIDDVLSSAEGLTGKTITMEGLCTHTCKHGGKKMFLMGSDDTKTLRIDAGEKIGSFPQEVVNNIVEVTGTLVEERIDEALIEKMETQYRNRMAEAHGEDVKVGCESENNARGQKGISTFEQRMQNYRERIAARKAKEGKEYLSFYAFKGETYKVKQ